MVIVSREIERSDIPIQYNGKTVRLRLARVRLWDNPDKDDCCRFNVQIKIRNKEVKEIIDDKKLDGGTWTVIAHSDHNPKGGHDIRDKTDPKQLHIDVNPYDHNYNKCYKNICGGNPPESNSEAIKYVCEFIKDNSKMLLQDYLDYFNE